jgi:radical SAM enzyme (TIGR01210 family)
MTEQIQNGTLYGFFKDTRFAPSSGRSVNRLTQLLPGQGCGIWLDRKSDCCIFCRLPAGTRLAVMGEGFEDHFEPWTVPKTDYRAMIDASLKDSEGVDAITCFNGGSFLSDREIPADIRKYLYKRFADHPTATELMVESRPELVRPEILDEAAAIIGDKSFMVAIGLESMDDRIRNGLLKKFIGKQSFLRSLELLRARGMKSFVYVFLGTPGLTEKEAYEDAYNTISELADLGVDEIALSCAFIPPGGKLEEMFNADMFRPPWLWTVLRLIKDASERDWPLTVGGFEDFPPPIATAMNCGTCDDQLLGAIENHRQTGTLPKIHNCDCQHTWTREMTCDVRPSAQS